MQYAPKRNRRRVKGKHLRKLKATPYFILSGITEGCSTFFKCQVNDKALCS